MKILKKKKIHSIVKTSTFPKIYKHIKLFLFNQVKNRRTMQVRGNSKTDCARESLWRNLKFLILIKALKSYKKHKNVYRSDRYSSVNTVNTRILVFFICL